MTNIKVTRWFIIIFMLAILTAFIFFGALCSNQTMKIFFVGDALKNLKEDIYNAENVIVKENPTVFLGDSITEMYDLDTHFKDSGIPNIVNRGISSETTNEVLDRLPMNVMALAPKQVIILIGTNDLNKGATPDEIVSNIIKITKTIYDFNPNTRVFVQSILPVNKDAYILSKSIVNRRTNEDIDYINSRLAANAHSCRYIYIDTNSKLKDATHSFMDKQYTVDGLHVSKAGYKVMTATILEELKKYGN